MPSPGSFGSRGQAQLYQTHREMEFGKASQLARGMQKEKDIKSHDRPKGRIFPEFLWSPSMKCDFLPHEFHYDHHRSETISS